MLHEVPRTLQKGSETLQIGDLEVPFWEGRSKIWGRGTILRGRRSCLRSRWIGVWWSDATPCHKVQHGVHRVMQLWDIPPCTPLKPRVGFNVPSTWSQRCSQALTTSKRGQKPLFWGPEMAYFTSQSGREIEGPKTRHILYLIWTLIS